MSATEFNPAVSMVGSAMSTDTLEVSAADAIERIRGGKYQRQVEAIRELYVSTLEQTTDHKAAKRAVDGLKKNLPGIMFAGLFSGRGDDKLVSVSGLICTDLDNLRYGECAEVMEKAKTDPHAFAAFRSPTGYGVKIVLRVSGKANQWGGNFAAAKQHVADFYGLAIDEACKNIERLCFVSFDPQAFTKDCAALAPIIEERKSTVTLLLLPNAGTRQEIAERLLGQIRWEDSGEGFAHCPGTHMHSTDDGKRDCIVYLNGVPTIKCFHDSCRGVIDGVNHELRSQIGKAEKITFQLPESGTSAPKPELPAIVDAAEFIATALIEPPKLIAGILHQGSKLVVGGGSKSFKTWTLLDAALSVSHGVPWLGRETEKGPVLFLNFEIQKWSIQRRIAAIADAKRIRIEPGQLAIMNLRGRAAHYGTLLPQIKAAAIGKYSMIVLDPIYKLYGGTDENSAGDVAKLLNALEDLACTTGAAIAFGAHFSKGNQAGKESIDRISGSGVFARDPDSLLVLTRHEEDDAFTVEATLRNFEPLAPFVVRWDYPLMVPDAELDPAKLKQAGGRKPMHSPDDLLRLLTPGGMLAKEWIAAADNEGISARTFYRLKKTLEQQDQVIHERVSQLWKPVKTA
jgi:hypothetical protein